ncbi:hypothetical protein BOTBODRAFT_33084 [Botryobasidium botryosum FD-172 SS1]|uniref:3-methyl-2-oxobutanoate hydroxymethyltransferase n=1 Tax=Botryobasidium botryosum (strain FD-172 SS1) TaxID=930990 RepID=A0A067MDY2_BOTB1|nr:hypothetical protein BOTBODRAFT_33084 [Botryobasidium botryosum FD-172 SS1]
MIALSQATRAITRSAVAPFFARMPINTGRRWMSVRPQENSVGAGGAAQPPRKKVTIQRLFTLRAQSTPITVLTAYDYPTAQRTERHNVDICLVGDSLAQVCLGYPSTTRLTLSEMVHHCKAVARGASSPLLVADMPFGTYPSPEDAVRNAVWLVQEGRMEAVKLEGGVEIVPVVRALTSLGIPTMAHVGLLPQRHTAFSGYRVQGRDANAAYAVLADARALQAAGAFSIVLEAVPHALAGYITAKLDIPTIGIGAGPACSGQVLVCDDALGTWSGHKAKFVRRFAQVGAHADQGVAEYVKAVRDRSFPSIPQETYEIPEDEWNKFLELDGEVVKAQ